MTVRTPNTPYSKETINNNSLYDKLISLKANIQEITNSATSCMCITGIGCGPTKKASEQEASKNFLENHNLEMNY
jgi:hypothetical protein